MNSGNDFMTTDSQINNQLAFLVSEHHSLFEVTSTDLILKNLILSTL